MMSEEMLREMYPHLRYLPLPILSAYYRFDTAYRLWRGKEQ